MKEFTEYQNFIFDMSNTNKFVSNFIEDRFYCGNYFDTGIKVIRKNFSNKGNKEIYNVFVAGNRVLTTMDKDKAKAAYKKFYQNDINYKSFDKIRKMNFQIYILKI